jgi:hypothetical protein
MEATSQKRAVDDVKANGKTDSRDASPVQSTSKGGIDGDTMCQLADLEYVLTSKRQEAQDERLEYDRRTLDCASTRLPESVTASNLYS